MGWDKNEVSIFFSARVGRKIISPGRYVGNTRIFFGLRPIVVSDDGRWGPVGEGAIWWRQMKNKKMERE